MKKLLLLILMLTFFSNCKKSIQQPKDGSKKPKLNIAVNHSKPDALDIYSQVKIENWKEYTNVASFLERFDNISPNEALNNALELKDLIKSFKDSIKPQITENNAFKARVNVLQNEVLRLTDMTYIPSIKAEAVNNQVVKILEVFGSINQKINTLYSQKRFEDAITKNEEADTINTTASKNIILKEMKPFPKKKTLNNIIVKKKKPIQKLTSKRKFKEQ